jgi:polyphosphate kinase
VAPRSVRTGLVERIEAEIAHAKAGRGGLVQFKVNSIVDEQVIDALYGASQAGVKVDIWVRGICALRPGVEGLSENIEVHSILGRFLEHSRVFIFGGGGETEVWIGIADMMHLNLDRRVEAMVRVTDPRHVDELASLLARGMSDDYSHWRLSGDGRWTRVTCDGDGVPLMDLQTALIGQHAKRRRKARRR